VKKCITPLKLLSRRTQLQRVGMLNLKRRATIGYDNRAVERIDQNPDEVSRTKVEKRNADVVE